ncbi:ferric reductase-like transmembrane domain-containing protein [Candidatus Saccharibacteria bacterium]|nr:MAG: ferric reductase-like transmembrane domain-containing protein [Candidatus Saccharibacteria bacterium]
MTENIKRRWLVGLMVVSMLPLPFFVKMPTWSISSSVWLYVSAVAGYIGLVMLLWMYILGTKTVMGLYFRDLAPVLSIHKWLGKYGTLLIFLHPLAVAFSYGGEIVDYIIKPNLAMSFERSVTWGRFALYALGIVWLTSALVRGRIAFRPWKYIHYLAYLALPLALVHVPSIGSSYRALDAPRIYFISVLFLLVLFSILRLRHLFRLGRAKYSVTKHTEISPNVWLIALKPTGRILTPRRGQYVYLQWSLLGEEHPFSVLQTDSETGELTIAYKTRGLWTRKLTALRDGDELFLDGSYGEFMSDISLGNTKPTVFIAAGIGITPFVEQLLAASKSEQWLFYANQRPESATFHRQFRQRLGDRYVSIFSRVDTPASFCDERGHMRGDVIAKYLTSPADYHFYICGSEGFMHTAETSLQQLGIPSTQIHTEAFGW